MDRFSTAVLFAEGATSQVYRARDPETGSEVALKLLRSDDPELHRRFLLEIRALRRLDHPCIASFVDHGEIDGRPYLAMAFADGIPFDRALAGQPPEVVVGALLKVADALAHAHDQGLLHRDLKPANIPVHKAEGEFEPVLVDFGLARDVAAPSETATGALLGTPAFMAPEQARGERESVDRRTDVYGLAAVLYAALSGRPPHTGGSAGDVIASILSGPPARPDPRLPRALEAILDRAMAQRPADRYPSARQFAADLEAWLNGQSVRALRGFRWRLARRAMVRHKWLTAGVAAGVVAVLALGVQQAWLQQQATQQREVAVRLATNLPPRARKCAWCTWPRNTTSAPSGRSSSSASSPSERRRKRRAPVACPAFTTCWVGCCWIRVASRPRSSDSSGLAPWAVILQPARRRWRWRICSSTGATWNASSIRSGPARPYPDDTLPRRARRFGAWR